MSLDTTARNAAAKYIPKFGKSITLTRKGTPSYNTSTGVATISSASETVYAIVEEYKGNALQDPLIQHGDKKLTIAASLTTKPLVLDAFTIDTETFLIVSVKSIYGQLLPAIYEIQARKA